MADVNVTTWAELTAALNSAEDTDIYLMNDIDLNDELPEGVTVGNLGNVSRCIKTLNGNGHTLKNLRVVGNGSGTWYLFRGYSSSYKMTIDNINFLNVYLAGNNTEPRFFYGNEIIRNSIINIDADQGSFADAGDTFYHCAINFTSNNSKNKFSTASNTNRGAYFENCNIKLEGTMYPVFAVLNDTYLSGNYGIDASNNYSGGFSGSNRSIINVSTTLPKRLLAINANAVLINMDNITVNGDDESFIPDTLIRCTTEELKNAQALRDKGFPIGVD